MSELPNNWIETEIGNLCALKNGRAFKPSEWQSSGLPIVRIQNLNNPVSAYNYFRGEVDERNRLRGGELLFAWSGTPGTSFGAHVWRGGDAVLNQHIFRVDFDETLLDKRFFRSAINQKLGELIDVAHGGVGLRHVTKGVFERTLVAVPPRAEQTRIANQLDTLLTRIQSCNDRFDAIPALLKRFRQAVLEAAVTGGLTKDWRTNANFEVKEVALRDLGAISGGLTKNSKRDSLPLRKPYLRVANVHANNLRLGDVTEIGLTPAEYEKTRLQFGDLLIVEGNGSLDHIGRVAMWRGELAECCHQNHLIRWRAGPEAHANYVLLWLLSPTGRTQIVNAASSSTGLHTLSVSKVGSLTLRMPSAEEQAEIVRRVEAFFALADRIEARATAARTQAQRLSPLVLAKAFRGELVQQDPQDEPASVLLQRLAATPPAKAKASRGLPRAKAQELFATPEGVQPDAAGLPNGVWAAPEAMDEHAVTAMLVAVLKAWGSPMPQMQARLAAVLCLQPRQMTAVLPAEQAAQWQRLLGPVADPLPTQVARLQPATDGAWRKALLGMRARGDLVEEGAGPQATWALGSGAGQIETAGWPEGRAGWVVAYLRARGAEAILPLLEPLTVEFVHARAA